MLLEKVPPQNTELEKAILGAIMLEKRAYEQAAEIIHPDFFYNDQHAEIFQAMTDMHQKGI
ncbi:MAG: replicative DNA helicase, partial [Proteobacteria bacterium]